MTLFDDWLGRSEHKENVWVSQGICQPGNAPMLIADLEVFLITGFDSRIHDRLTGESRYPSNRSRGGG
jgi:hypothetical protein